MPVDADIRCMEKLIELWREWMGGALFVLGIWILWTSFLRDVWDYWRKGKKKPDD